MFISLTSSLSELTRSYHQLSAGYGSIYYNLNLINLTKTYFRCVQCFQPFKDPNDPSQESVFYEHEDRPYCHNCYTVNFAPMCFTCGELHYLFVYLCSCVECVKLSSEDLLSNMIITTTVMVTTSYGNYYFCSLHCAYFVLFLISAGISPVVSN